MPELNQIVEIKEVDSVNYWALDNGVIGCSFFVDLADCETDDLDSYHSQMQEFLKNLSLSIKFRVFFYSQYIKSSRGDHYRSNVIKEMGEVENVLIFNFEMNTSPLKSLFRGVGSLLSKKSAFESTIFDLKSFVNINFLKNLGISYRSLNEKEIYYLLPNNNTNDIVNLGYGVDLGHSVIGVVRLRLQGTLNLNMMSLNTFKDSLPLDYQYRIAIQRMSGEKTEIQLRRKSNLQAHGTDNISHAKYIEAQEALEEVSLFGGSTFIMEVLILVPRLDEKSVRMDCERICRELKPIGDFVFETYGCLNSYLAAQIGSDFHVTLAERDVVVPLFIPLASRGESESKKIVSKESLALERLDGSYTYFTPFNSSYDNHNVCIIGLSGRGKSVLTNLITNSLLNDPDVMIIKVDVGGSHSKETKMFGGREYKLSLTKPSGINPFSILKEKSTTDDIINLLSTFLSGLLLEDGERVLSKEIRGQVEDAIKEYVGICGDSPSLDDFYQKIENLPRKMLLKRWVKDGVYKNAFKEFDEILNDRQNRLRYYNFEKIFEASDPDFGMGGLSAVIVQFYTDMIKHRDKKLVFILDESPFFVENSKGFEFLKFATANVRKFGASFITIAQKSIDLIVNGDAGIIENSATKILFTVDGDAKKYAQLMRLSPNEIHSLMELKKGPKGKFMLVDQFGCKVLHARLTKLEYWKATSSKGDGQKLKALMNAVPSLKLEEAIQCLSITS